MTVETESSGPFTGMAGHVVEVLYETERTRVSRVSGVAGTRSFVRKEPLGRLALSRARRERRILDRLASVSGVARLVAAYPGDGLVFEDLGSETLATLIRDGGPGLIAPVDVALELTRVVAGVHRAGVVHKDINPANILLLGPQHRPVLIDFDLAGTSGEDRPRFGHHREIVGTLPYLAPEQTGRTGGSVDERADLYALGATFYELATGQPPFEDGDPLRMVHDTLARAPVPPAEVNADVPPQFSKLIMRLLEKDPDRRYQSAEGLEHDLSQLRQDLAVGRDELFALGRRDFPWRLLAPSRLVGRDDEINILRAAFDAVGGASGGVFVAGAPGVGKTALVDTLRSAVTEAEGWFVTGKFDQYRHDAESNAVLQALRGLGRLLLAGTDTELAVSRTRITSALGLNIGLAAAVLPEFAKLLEIEPGLVLVAPAGGDAGAVAARLQQMALDVLGAVASPEHPVVVVIDDLQWAGSVEVGFVDAVLTDERLRGVLLVGAYRDREVDAAHPLATALTRWGRLPAPPALVRLGNLETADLGQLLAEMLRLPAPEGAELANAIGARTGGNPFDTVELVNALRRDGALVAGESGWAWDPATVRRFVGRGDVVDMLAARIDQLPSGSQQILEMIACLGGEVDLNLLTAASGLSNGAVDERLLAPLEDGLLLLEAGDTSAVRFRHDRVQQAAYSRLGSRQRRQLHLAMARRLRAVPGRGAVTAEQYLEAGDAVEESGERRLAAGLFAQTAAAVGVLNPVAAEGFLTAAIGALGVAGTASDGPLLASVERQRHGVLYRLGRLAEADTVYAAIKGRSDDPMDLAGPACTQVDSLAIRGQPAAAVTLGVALLGRLGVSVPDGDLTGALEQWAHDLADRITPAALARDLDRPETADARVVMAAKLINRLLPAAFFCDPATTTGLTLASQQLWVEHGPCAPQVVNLSSAATTVVMLREDYTSAYAVAKHALAVGEKHGYEPETSFSRHMFSLFGQPWFEPVEDTVHQSQLAREGLLRGGDLQMACFTHFSSLAALVDSGPTLEGCAKDLEAALAFAARTGNEHGTGCFLAYQQLLAALRGETSAPGSFSDGAFDETLHLAGLASNPMGAAYFHIYRALSAALFDDPASLIEHTAAATALLPYIGGSYPLALARVLQGLALAEQIRSGPPGENPALLAALDACTDWLSARAVDAPTNFGHLATLLKAERAWAAGDLWEAAGLYDAARRQVASRQRPWQRAVITERAGLFHLAHGHDQTGRDLLVEAKGHYAAWSATGKVDQLETQHPFLRSAPTRSPSASTNPSSTRHSSGASADDIDMLAVLHASQALSSETSPDRLRGRIGELLTAMTGATTVLIAQRPEGSDGWLVWDTTGDTADGTPIAEAATAGLLPLSVFRYAERTREPLLVEDATHDDRFARDPYLAGLQRCSVLAVPIINQGALRAVLLLENRQRKGAFAADGLDAVMLVTGQLTVSLENAQLYASLERKVIERTEALEEANLRLEALSNTDALTRLPNRRSFDTTLDLEWRRAVRQQTPLGVAMIDVDQFKLYNDHYGHVAGDACLRLVADVLDGARRSDTDRVFRYGGEEFAVLFPGSDGTASLKAAERIRAAVAAMREPHPMADSGTVTVSIGVAVRLPGSTTTANELVTSSDTALYDAKEHGRNQVSPAPSHRDLAR